MSEFDKQLKKNLNRDVSEFISKPDYESIRQLYKDNFDKIVFYIKRSDVRLAVEDIADIDVRLTKKVIDSVLLLKEVNRAILSQELTLNDII
ncbi:hypothetical protein [Flavobacterium nitrogenifigens]|uniref:hypothetical protein n=1 Tax=Flavobacterium nitrogenifigens TaxID=1617283 RepID=UPI00319F0D15